MHPLTVLKWLPLAARVGKAIRRKWRARIKRRREAKAKKRKEKSK